MIVVCGLTLPASIGASARAIAMSAVVDFPEGAGGPLFCEAGGDVGEWTLRVPWRFSSPPVPRIDGDFDELYEIALGFRPLRPEETIRLLKVGVDVFGYEIWPPWKIVTVVGRVGGGDERFTLQIPGLTDIFRTPWTESAQLRRERYARFKAARSPLPGFLQWVPPLLTKLDDAQDLLFTGLALAWPVFKFLLPRAFLGPLGWLLLVSDLFNAFT